MIENFLESLFDLRRIPGRFLLVVCLCSASILFIPDKFLLKLNLTEFIVDYGKFIGITFLISFVFVLIAVIGAVKKNISKHIMIHKTKKAILRAIENLDYHEKALLREFAINGKSAIQLPINDGTVVGLVNKHILYRASNVGGAYLGEACFPFSITEFAEERLTTEMLDIPNNPTEEDRKRILQDRPTWAKQQSYTNSLLNSFW